MNNFIRLMARVCKLDVYETAKVYMYVYVCVYTYFSKSLLAQMEQGEIGN